MRHRGLRGVSRGFPRLSPCMGQVAYALLTRAPVAGSRIATAPLPLDLHVLSLSLAFILSQDQTLRCCILSFLFSLLPQGNPGNMPNRPPGRRFESTEGFRPLPSSCLILSLIAFFQCSFFSATLISELRVQRYYHSPFQSKYFPNYFSINFQIMR